MAWKKIIKYHTIFFPIFCCVHYLISCIPNFLTDLCYVIFISSFFAIYEKNILKRGSITAERNWYYARILFSLLQHAVLYVFLHNFFLGKLHICFDFKPNISVSSWREAFIAIAEAIGIGSAIIMAIIGVLDKREFGISLAQLVQFAYPGYELFIIFHFSFVIATIFFSYAWYFEVAFLCLVSLLFISIALSKIFSFLILETHNRRKVTLQYFNKVIRNSTLPDIYIDLLINQLDEIHNSKNAEIINEIKLGFLKITNGYTIEELLPNESIDSLAKKTIAATPSMEKLLVRLTSFWSRINNERSPAYRNAIVDEFEVSFNKGLFTPVQQIIIVLSYINSLIHESTQNGQTFGQAIAYAQENVFFGVAETEEINTFKNIAKLAIALLFWIHIFSDRPTNDFNIFKNVALYAKTDSDLYDYRHIFFSFTYIVFCGQSWGLLINSYQEHFIEDCVVAWNQITPSTRVQLVGTAG